VSLLAPLLLGLALTTAEAQDAPSRAEAEAALEAAYQQEIAYLVAEKRALDRRLEELQQQRRRAEVQSDARIAGLQGRVLGLERRADQVEHNLSELSDATIAVSERKALLDSTVQQARDALGIELPEDATDADQLRVVFQTALAGLEKGGRIESGPGAFFLPDGTQVDGNVVQVGQIAVYGEAGSSAGPLLPLGNGRLMLRTAPEGADDARRLVKGDRPASLGMFLIESLDKPVSERTERTVLQTIEAGGLVAWVIVLLGVLAVLLAGLRALLLLRAGSGQAVIAKVLAAIEQRDLSGARKLVAPGRTPTDRVLRAVLSAEIPTDTDPREALQDIAAAAILEETPAVERFGALILVIAAVAPLLGLLGTVTGMIATFEIITELGTGDPAMLSGGIGEALITTQLGLVVAIPAVLLGNVLKGRQNEVLRRLDHAALSVVNVRCDGTSVSSASKPPASSAA
jgi:biopolymer transport protein ExbB